MAQDGVGGLWRRDQHTPLLIGLAQSASFLHPAHDLILIAFGRAAGGVGGVPHHHRRPAEALARRLLSHKLAQVKIL